jgi:hypothetical protein
VFRAANFLCHNSVISLHDYHQFYKPQNDLKSGNDSHYGDTKSLVVSNPEKVLSLSLTQDKDK